MSGHRWAPGAVAMVTWAGATEVRILARTQQEAEPVWWGAGGYVRPEAATEINPVVVIDPEDTETIARLAELYAADLACPNYATIRVRLAQALRGYAAPTLPKPAEPTGLGAVVEDSKGQRWIRVSEDASRPWAFHGNVGFVAVWVEYAKVPAVRVLSEGVS